MEYKIETQQLFFCFALLFVAAIVVVAAAVFCCCLFCLFFSLFFLILILYSFLFFLFCFLFCFYSISGSVVINRRLNDAETLLLEMTLCAQQYIIINNVKNKAGLPARYVTSQTLSALFW